jgi:hypothetical protein
LSFRIAAVPSRFCIWTSWQGLLNQRQQADGPAPRHFAKAKERHMKKILTTAAFAMTSTAAFAHPGEHGFSVLNSLWHLVTEPDHLVMLAVAVVVGAAVAYKYFRRAV